MGRSSGVYRLNRKPINLSQRIGIFPIPKKTMKATPLSFLIPLLLLVGCQFKVPLLMESEREIDPCVTGLWKALPGQDKENKLKEKSIRIEKASATAYSITYILQTQDNEPAWYFKGIPAELDGIDFIQLELVASKGVNSKGKQDFQAKPGDRPYIFFSYHMENGILALTPLDLPTHHTSSEALQKAFREQKKAGKLLGGEPRKYRKSQTD